MYLLFSLLMWSSMEVLTKPLMQQVDPFFLTFFRFLVGGIFLVIFAKKKISLKDAGVLALIGCLNGVVSMSLLQLSIKFSNASTAATLVATNPLFVSIFAFALGKEKLNFKKFVGVVIGLIGIFVLSYGKVEGDSTFGLICGVGAAITFALYTVLMKDFTLKYGSMNATAFSTLFAGIVYGAILLLAGKLDIPEVALNGWIILLYSAIFVTGLAYVTFFKAVEKLGPSRASLVFYLKPAVASFFAFLILSEPVGIFKFVGTAIIIVALFIK
ncbi:DMT family transporter [Pseudothermotoga elfii]